jgi:hypothetical protein
MSAAWRIWSDICGVLVLAQLATLLAIGAVKLAERRRSQRTWREFERKLK